MKALKVGLVSLFIPLAALARIAAMQPQGMTPISAAVTQVADLLKGRAAETTIVLLSDGQETCGGDPCATVQAL